MFSFFPTAVSYTFGTNLGVNDKNITGEINKYESINLLKNSHSATEMELIEDCDKLCDYFIKIMAIGYAIGAGVITSATTFNLSGMTMDEAANLFLGPLSPLNETYVTGNHTALNTAHFFSRALYDESIFNQVWMIGGFAIMGLFAFLGMGPFNALGGYGDAHEFLQKYFKWCKKQRKSKKTEHFWKLKLAKGLDEFIKYFVSGPAVAIVVGEFVKQATNTTINLFRLKAFMKNGPIENPIWLNWICWPLGYIAGGLPMASAIDSLMHKQLSTSVHVLSNTFGMCYNDSWYKCIKKNKLPNPDMLTNREIRRGLQVIFQHCIQAIRFSSNKDLKKANINLKDDILYIITKIIHESKHSLCKELLADVILPVVGIFFVYQATRQYGHVASEFPVGLFRSEPSYATRETFSVFGQTVMFIPPWVMLTHLIYPQIMSLFIKKPSSFQRKITGREGKNITKITMFKGLSIFAAACVSLMNFAILDYNMPTINLIINIASFLTFNTIFSYYGLVENSKRYGILPKSLNEKIKSRLEKMLYEIKINNDRVNRKIYTKIYTHMCSLKNHTSGAFTFFENSIVNETSSDQTIEHASISNGQLISKKTIEI